jgi:phosphatidylglycerol:prolipoprotein diacylglycerol transferase
MIPSPAISSLSVGMLTISFYGLLVSLGFLAAYALSLFCARRYECEEERVSYRGHIDRAVLWIVVGGVVAARMLFVLYHLDYFSVHPEEVIAVWHGGWVWHGGLVGGGLGLFFYCRRNRVSLLRLFDILAPGVALGQSIGRWGNFFNQEAYGLPTNLPWGITIDPAWRVQGYEAFSTFHPTFLYESVLDGALAVLLGWMVIRTERDSSTALCSARDDAGENGVRKEGTIFFLYLALYSLGRFGIEFFRIDRVPIILGLRAPQWISLILIAIGVSGLARVLHKQKKMV